MTRRMSERIIEIYYNRKIKVDETDKIKRREPIGYKSAKQIPSDHDK